MFERSETGGCRVLRGEGNLEDGRKRHGSKQGMADKWLTRPLKSHSFITR